MPLIYNLAKIYNLTDKIESLLKKYRIKVFGKMPVFDMLNIVFILIRMRKIK
jgi:hypothetical protein